jgi:hypothetical protein
MFFPLIFLDLIFSNNKTLHDIIFYDLLRYIFLDKLTYRSSLLFKIGSPTPPYIMIHRNFSPTLPLNEPSLSLFLHKS